MSRRVQTDKPGWDRITGFEKLDIPDRKAFPEGCSIKPASEQIRKGRDISGFPHAGNQNRSDIPDT